MPDVLGVSTLQIGDPVAFGVLVEAYDPGGHCRGIGVIRGKGARQRELP
jgi:hypothetical protein